MKTYSKTTKAESLKAQRANSSRRNGSAQLANITDEHISALDKIANKPLNAVTQKKSNPEEEELMQGKFMTAQLAAPEEEELLQGKFETAQQQEFEDEEMLQGKFEAFQKKSLEDEEPLQGNFIAKQLQAEEKKLVQTKPNFTGLPGNLKTGVESLSGYSMDDVTVHYNSTRPAQLNAHAYAQGTDIHIASGQEKHLPHEAWHVVQQKQGRVKPTLQMKGGINVNDDQGLENEADVMGMKSLQMKAKILNKNGGGQVHPNTSIPPLVMQRNKHVKRLKNVLTLGIRKAYVKNKRAKRALALEANEQPQVPEGSPLDHFVGAYGKSRYYQQTHADNLPSIEKHGLLNYEDRERDLPENVIGMSALGGEYEGDEKKGVFLAPKHLMKENKMTKNVARAFLPAERTKIHHWDKEDTVPRQELYRDEKFRGGAVITKDSIPPEQVTTGNMLDLLEQDDPKLESILAAVGSQYEGEVPDHETLKGHLRQAILERRLSNAAFDDSEEI